MPSFLEYVGKTGELPRCLTASFAALIAFYSTDIQALTDKGLVCRRPKGNEYVCSDDRWVLEFYYERRGAEDAALIRDVMTNRQMWGQDLTQVAGFEAAVTECLTTIREKGALAAYKACL